MIRSIPVTLGIISCCLLPSIQAQGLFESAGEDSGNSGTQKSKLFSLNGYVKGSFYGGQNIENDPIISGANAQVSLKLDSKISEIGKVFTEVRLNAGIIRDSSSINFDIREAWASVSKGPLDVKVGRQIVSWGRADALNPTNNITPKNETVLSSEFDDTRLGNELLQVKTKFGISSLQGIWIPNYRADVLPLSGADIPSSITIGKSKYPDLSFKNGGYAFRYELTHSLIDGSLSYFNGYATLPGFDFFMDQNGLILIPHAYRMQAMGADFSTAVKSIGLRGEAALKYPVNNYKNSVYIPNPFAQYVFGIDKSIANVTFLLQYSGLYVLDFNKIPVPVLKNPDDLMSQYYYAAQIAAKEIKEINRLFTGTTDRASHSITGNIQLSSLYETLHFKLAGMYNFTTKDFAVNPSVSYDIADAINISIGGRYIDGPKESLNAMVSNLLSFAYAEL
ncbi:MAG: hypothetical protein GX640_21635, partial [Fibrobacter sp.]|nr:hypothetical protein [Fibrobacter sp.]